jgi:hypothetical protein
MQPGTFYFSLEDGQLLTKCQIFQCDMLVTAEHKNDESNPSQDSVQHEKKTVPSSDRIINPLLAHEVLANDMSAAACWTITVMLDWPRSVPLWMALRHNQRHKMKNPPKRVL